MSQRIFLLVLSVWCKAVEAATCDNFQEVVCSAPKCKIVGNSAVLENGRRVSCNVTYVRAPQKIDPNTETAPPTDFGDIACHQVFMEKPGKYKAALTVRWGNQEYHIRKNLVKGYYLHFGQQEYRVTLNTHGESQMKKLNVPPCIKFIYNCYGQAYHQYLTPGRFQIKIQPVPRCKKGADPCNVRNIAYTLPDVSNCLVPDPEAFTSDRIQPTITGLSSSIPNPHWIDSTIIESFVTSNNNWNNLIVVLPVGLVVASVCIGVFVHKCRKRQNPAKDISQDVGAGSHLLNSSKSILIVANRMKAEDCQRAHNVATGLRNCSHINVVCNFENVKEIVHEQKPMSWWDKTVESVDTIIFVNGAELLRQSRKRHTDKETREPDEMNEFEFFLEYHIETSGFTKKKNIFLDDKPEDVKYIEDQNPKSCRGFLLEDYYGEGHPLYEELFISDINSNSNRSKRCNRSSPNRMQHILHGADCNTLMRDDRVAEQSFEMSAV